MSFRPQPEPTPKWAYRAIRQGWPEYDQWLKACYERTCAYNLQFLTPLDENEVAGIAKSIAKWTHKNFSEESFSDFVLKTHTSELQSKRGRIGGAIGGKISKGGRRPSLGEPWISLGISRHKFFL